LPSSVTGPVLLIVEVAWAYRMPAKIGQDVNQRQEALPMEIRGLEGAGPALRSIPPNAHRAFCYADDLVRLLGTPESVTGPVNLGNPDEFSIRALAETEIELTGSPR
jgi:nucleoside-diphosphate-sugar epimerase